MLEFFIRNVSSQDVIMNSMLALSKMSSCDDVEVDAILDMDIMDVVLNMMKGEDRQLKNIACSIISNIAFVSDRSTRIVLEYNIMEPLSLLIHSRSRLDINNSYMILLSLLTTKHEQIDRVLTYNNYEITNKLIDLAVNNVSNVSTFPLDF